MADFNADSGTLHVRKSKANKDKHIILTDDGRDFFADLAVGRKKQTCSSAKNGGPAIRMPLSRRLASGRGSTRRFRFTFCATPMRATR